MKRDNTQMDRGLLKCFLLLQSEFPAISKLVVEESVADRANGRSKAEQKRSTKGKHYQQTMKWINQE